jgi:hypothetical protein
MVSPELIRRARQADLVEYLSRRGYELKREGQNYRVVGHGGLLVRGNHYKHFSTGEGGNSLDFLTKILGIPFRQAVQELTGQNPGENTIRVVKTPAKIPSPLNGQNPGENTVLIMPARAKDNRRVYAYLTKTRGLPSGMVNELVKTGLIYQDGRGNCVFPCLDVGGRPRGAILRGTLSDVRFQGRATGSDTSYGWWWPPSGESDLVTVTESPIDAMSFVVLRPGARAGHILALGGLHQEAVEGFLGRVKLPG